MSDLSYCKKVVDAVAKMLEKYPHALLEDICKSFFQDEFGPGHLLNDVQASRLYLLRELSQMESLERYQPEPCGLGQNFYRVNLDMIKDEIISFDQFFTAFTESATAFALPTAESWKQKWMDIEGCLKPLKTLIADFDKSQSYLQNRLNQGKVVVHHSKRYVESYHPHYRIIHKQVLKKYFEGLLTAD